MNLDNDYELTNESEDCNCVEEAYFDGMAMGYLTARYFFLRFSSSDLLLNQKIPQEPPEVIRELMSRICRDCIYEALFERGWSSLDDLLLCNNKAELEAALANRHNEQRTHHSVH